MSGLIHRKFSFTSGASRLDVSPELISSFVEPDAANLIKEESKTIIWRVKLAPDENVIVKMYRRRGIVDWNRERVVRFRVQREYEALRVLENANAPCSAPLFWGYGSVAEHGRFEILITREIPNAHALKSMLAQEPGSVSSADLLSLFEVIRQMHRSGIYHGALLPKNILITRSEKSRCSFHLIDMARAIRFPKDISLTKMARADLLGLMRSLVQMRGDAGCEEMLLRYGWPKEELKVFMGRLKHYPSSRKGRNRLTLSFMIRYWLSKIIRG